MKCRVPTSPREATSLRPDRESSPPLRTPGSKNRRPAFRIDCVTVETSEVGSTDPVRNDGDFSQGNRIHPARLRTLRKHEGVSFVPRSPLRRKERPNRSRRVQGVDRAGGAGDSGHPARGRPGLRFQSGQTRGFAEAGVVGSSYRLFARAIPLPRLPSFHPSQAISPSKGQSPSPATARVSLAVPPKHPSGNLHEPPLDPSIPAV